MCRQRYLDLRQIVGEIMVQIIQRVGGGLLVCINIDYSCHVETESITASDVSLRGTKVKCKSREKGGHIDAGTNRQ